MSDFLTAQNAIVAKRIITASLMRDDNCTPSKAVEIAAWDCLNESNSMSLAAFLEGAQDAANCHLRPSTIRTCWYRARREWAEAAA